MAKRKISEKSLENLKKAKPFKKNSEGIDERINRTGLNKGSGWNKNLLERFMSVDLTDTEIEQFAKIKQQFPSLFRDDDALNYQTFLEVKQISLAFHKDPKVAQSAIEKIKDRIEGRAVQKVAQTDTDGNDVEHTFIIGGKEVTFGGK